MPSPRPSPLAAVATMMWPLFLACSVLVAIIWLSGFGAGLLADPAVERKMPNADLRSALALFSRVLDSAWITLGAVNVYFALVRTEGLATARRWCGLVLGMAFAIAATSALTGVPFGPVYFPTNLGMKIGPVPFALPFLWLLIAVGAHETILRTFPKLSHGLCALLTGLCCALSSLLIDPVAWKFRAWWLWYPAQLSAPNSAPWSAHVTWLIAGSALGLLMRPSHVAPRIARPPKTATASVLIVLGLFALTRLIR